MLRKKMLLQFFFPFFVAQIIAAAPFASDTTVPHDKGKDGLLTGIKSWMLVDAPDGTKSNHCNYAIGAAPNGDIYIGGQDHITNSTLFRLDRRTDILWFVGDARTASLEADNWEASETCEKFHCRPTYVDGRVYVASADYSPEDSGYLQQRGFHWYVYDEKINKFLDLSAKEPDGIGGKNVSIMALAADEKRAVIYGLSQPVTKLFSYDIKKGLTTDLGTIPFAPTGYYTCSRYLWIDKDGRVYFTIKPLKYVLYYDPNTGEYGQRTDWVTLNQYFTNIRNGVWTLDGKYHYLADYEGNFYKFSVDDITWEFIGQAKAEDTAHYKTFPTGKGFRIRTMSISADGKKIYFLNDEATKYSLFEYDIASNTTTRICYRTELEETYNNLNYNDHAGHNVWDSKGRFYISSFYGYPNSPQTVQVIMTRIDPVRLKAQLGFLPGLTEVSIQSKGPNISLKKTGYIASDLEVILSIEENGRDREHNYRHEHGTVHKQYKTVIIPANKSSLELKLKDILPAEHKNDKGITVKVIPNGNTYIYSDADR